MIAALIAGLALTISAARASFFDVAFSTDPDGVLADTISGELVNLQNGTDVDPSQVLFYSLPASFGVAASMGSPYVFTPYTYETGTTMTGIQSTTTAGVYGLNITGGTVQSSTDVAFYDAAGNGVGFNFYNGANGAEFNGVYDYSYSGFSGASFTTVPEMPHTAALCLLGLALLVAGQRCWTRFRPAA